MTIARRWWASRASSTATRSRPAEPTPGHPRARHAARRRIAVLPRRRRHHGNFSPSRRRIRRRRRRSSARSVPRRLRAGQRPSSTIRSPVRRFSGDERSTGARRACHHFVPCVVEGRDDCGRGVGRARTAEPLEQRGHGAARRGRRSGRDGARERASTGSSSGRPTNRAAPAVQRQRRRVAQRRPGRRRSGDRVVRWNRRARDAARPRCAAAPSARCPTIFDNRFVDSLRAARREAPVGDDAVPGAAQCRGTARATVAARQPRYSRRSGPTARRPAGSLVSRGRHRPREARRAAAAVREDGGDRPAGRRRGARGQHAAHRDLELHADAARGRDPTIRARQLLEKIERQTFRAAKIVNNLSNLARPGAGDTAAVDINAVVGDILSLLEHQFEDEPHPGAQGARRAAAGGARRRVQAAAGLPQSLPQRARRDAEGRLAVGRARVRATRSGRSKSPTPASGFRPSTSRASTTRSSRRKRTAAAPAWACRSPTASCRSTAARSHARATSARAPVHDDVAAPPAESSGTRVVRDVWDDEAHG